MLLFLGRYVPPHLRNTGSFDGGRGYNGPPATGERERERERGGGRGEKNLFPRSRASS